MHSSARPNAGQWSEYGSDPDSLGYGSCIPRSNAPLGPPLPSQGTAGGGNGRAGRSGATLSSSSSSSQMAYIADCFNDSFDPDAAASDMDSPVTAAGLPSNLPPSLSAAVDAALSQVGFSLQFQSPNTDSSTANYSAQHYKLSPRASPSRAGTTARRLSPRTSSDASTSGAHRAGGIDPVHNSSNINSNSAVPSAGALFSDSSDDADPDAALEFFLDAIASALDAVVDLATAPAAPAGRSGAAALLPPTPRSRRLQADPMAVARAAAAAFDAHVAPIARGLPGWRDAFAPVAAAATAAVTAATTITGQHGNGHSHGRSHNYGHAHGHSGPDASQNHGPSQSFGPGRTSSAVAIADAVTRAALANGAAAGGGSSASASGLIPPAAARELVRATASAASSSAAGLFLRFALSEALLLAASAAASALLQVAAAVAAEAEAGRAAEAEAAADAKAGADALGGVLVCLVAWCVAAGADPNYKVRLCFTNDHETPTEHVLPITSNCVLYSHNLCLLHPFLSVCGPWGYNTPSRAVALSRDRNSAYRPRCGVHRQPRQR